MFLARRKTIKNHCSASDGKVKVPKQSQKFGSSHRMQPESEKPHHGDNRISLPLPQTNIFMRIKQLLS